MVRNTSRRAVEWLELRLDSSSQVAGAPASACWAWGYRERVALRFERAPTADEIEVRVDQHPRRARRGAVTR